MINIIKSKILIIGTGQARSTIMLIILLLTVLLSSCGTFVGEVLAPTVTDTQIGLGGKKTSGATTNSKQTAKEQEKLKEEGKCPVCRGVGKSSDGQYECPSCKGTGKFTHTYN